MISDPATLTTVALGALGVGAGALRLAQSVIKHRNGNVISPVKQAWIDQISKLFDEKTDELEKLSNERTKDILMAQEKENERAIGDMRALVTARDERIMPLLEELKKISQQQVEIQQKQNEILVELVTVSRIGRRT
jgi:predicted nucleotide-binding protein (sugar kinase/HSP70/actin superfamily)